jgi:hypothetical protein
LCESRLE